MTAAPQRDYSDFQFETLPTAELAAAQRSLMFELFDACYRQANHAHLEKSLGRLRYVSFASHDGRPAGFGVADSHVIDLPRLRQEHVTLGGLCCILPEFRRRGLFGELQRRSMAAAGPQVHDRRLSCGRVAHPAAARGLVRNPGMVPKPGVRPTAWQQEVGVAIANLYGVETFDPETFVCVGSGTPIGYPLIEMETEPHEWEVFRPVDRDRGDQLLAIAWSPAAPEGWEESGA